LKFNDLTHYNILKISEVLVGTLKPPKI